MAMMCGSDYSLRQNTKNPSKENMLECIKQYLNDINQNYITYNDLTTGKNKGPALPKYSQKGRRNLFGLEMVWDIEKGKLNLYIILKDDNTLGYELLETIRQNGCFYKIFNYDFPKVIQTLDKHISLSYCKNGEAKPYWQTEKMREQLVKQNTQTMREIMYSVVKKKEFNRQIDKQLPKLQPVEKLYGKSYIYLPILIGKGHELDYSK